jgi:hypothetical protein
LFAELLDQFVELTAIRPRQRLLAAMVGTPRFISVVISVRAVRNARRCLRYRLPMRYDRLAFLGFTEELR